MSVGVMERRDIEQQKAADYERSIEECLKPSRLSTIRYIHDDIRFFGAVRPETWSYIRDQEFSNGAEVLDTKHITIRVGEYDAEADTIKAGEVGGKPIFYEDITTNGAKHSRERAEKTPRSAFQALRDQIYADIYHGPVKAMWHGKTDYDTVIQWSTFPDDEADKEMVDKMAFDKKTQKAFLYIYRRLPNGDLEFCTVRLGSGRRSIIGRNQQKLKARRIYNDHLPQTIDVNDASFSAVNSHEENAYISTFTSTGQTMEEIAKAITGVHDESLLEETGEQHFFGNKKEGIDAYDLFRKTPELWSAYFKQNELLGGHFAGRALDPQLKKHLIACLDSQADYRLDEQVVWRLGQQLMNDHITADMADHCKDILSYAHFAMLKHSLDYYNEHGHVPVLMKDENDLEGYAGAGGDIGGKAAENGDEFRDCDTVSKAEAAAKLAAEKGISIEEAMRLLEQQELKAGSCQVCGVSTMVGQCSICIPCADLHTKYGNAGLEAVMKKNKKRKNSKEFPKGSKNKSQKLPSKETSSPSASASVPAKANASRGNAQTRSY